MIQKLDEVDVLIQGLIRQQKDDLVLELSDEDRESIAKRVKTTFKNSSIREAYVERVKELHGPGYAALGLNALQMSHVEEVVERGLDAASIDAFATVVGNHLAFYKVEHEVTLRRPVPWELVLQQRDSGGRKILVAVPIG
jgi:hypothetical protein